MLRLPPLALAAAFCGYASTAVNAAGCYPEYDSSLSYAPGDWVSAPTTAANTTEVHNYECKSGAAGAFCKQAAFAPGGLFSGTAWTQEGAACTGVATPATPAPWSGAGCPQAYAAGTAYGAGDHVTVASAGGAIDMVYQCADEPASLHCGAPGYAPGVDAHWDQAWMMVGSCTGTMSPTSTPSFDVLADAGGCPAAFVEGAQYAEGDKASKDGLVYTCAKWPKSAHCGQDGYEPGSGMDAWAVTGHCSGTISPTGSPSFDALTDMGGCPALFDANAEYGEGDKVSLNGMVYQCAKWPVSAHCSQDGYEPGSGLDAWTVAGHCSGTISPTTSPSYDTLTDMGGCPVAFATGTPYGEGDRVSSAGLVYQCAKWPVSAHCGQEGYEPGSGLGAWALVGHCSGSIAPTTSPSFDTLADTGGCPQAWSKGLYEEGDRVARGGLVFECKAWPFSGNCGQTGYSPNDGVRDDWKVAWTVVGHCAGSMGPTASPSFDALTATGGCPEPWSAKSYEGGDMVSVTVSAAPLRQMAYRCKSWPQSGHCKQYSPTDEIGGPLGWTLVGSCSGTVTPTGSPSFDALAVASGCPAEWSAAASSYEAGSKVSLVASTTPVRKIVYECRAWPFSGYCNQAAFKPGSHYGHMGWTLMGACDGTYAPTDSPTGRPTTSAPTVDPLK